MYKKGSFWDRFSAFIIDQLITLTVVVVLIVSLTIFLRFYGFNIGNYGEVYSNIFGLIFITYNTLFIWKSGQTIGKKLLKLKVVDLDYQPVGFWRALFRESIGKILSGILNLGYLWVLIDKRKQSWHDKLAKTLVVKLDQNNNLIPISEEEVITGKRKILFIFMFLLFGIPLLLGGLFVILYTYIIQPHKITGSAMAPNFIDSQYYLSNKFVYRFDLPKRGEVVVFKYPKNREVDFFKRIVGLPGEKIKIQDCKVFINDRMLEELYLPAESCTRGAEFLEESVTLTIPDNNYIVLGDNRDFSSDSRVWGPVPKEDIIGRMDFCYYKCSESGKR